MWAWWHNYPIVPSHRVNKHTTFKTQKKKFWVHTLDSNPRHDWSKKKTYWIYFWSLHRMGAHYKNTSRLFGFEEDFKITKIYFHHEYNSLTSYNYDIALIRLDRPAIIRHGVDLACLPDDTVSFPPGSYCWITGWGTLQPGGSSPEELQQAEVPLVSNQECTKNGSYDQTSITSQMLCAGFPQGGKDACQGDSGGPLVCENNGKWYLVGDTSWGYSCAQPDYYGVYGRVADPELKNWVFHVMAHPDD